MIEKTPHIAVAPMLDWTDRHCRYFHRLIAPHVTLYTEMITTGALLHGDAARFLRFDKSEHPVVLQLGGSDPEALARCAVMGAEAGYDEINLNCGCPSDRVQSGAFGACLMARPTDVAACVAAMNKAVDIPVSIKCRIGIDDCEERPFLNDFIRTVKDAGCTRFTIHARKAWLKGLSPKENRDVPPLRYDIAQEIKEKYPDLTIIVNGGIKSIEQILALSPMGRGLGEGKNVSLPPSPQPSPSRERGTFSFDGVMIGREAYQNPWFLREIEETFFTPGAPSPVTPAQAGVQNNAGELLDSRLRGNDTKERCAIARAMIPYILEQHDMYGTPVKSITRHMIGLFHGQAGGKHWRRVLSTEAYKEGVDPATLIEDALSGPSLSEHI